MDSIQWTNKKINKKLFFLSDQTFCDDKGIKCLNDGNLKYPCEIL